MNNYGEEKLEMVKKKKKKYQTENVVWRINYD